MNPVRERIKYVTAVVLYGTIGYFLRFVSLPSEIVVFCRGFIGCLFLLAVKAVKKERTDREALRKELPWLILSGILLGLNWIFLFRAYVLTTVAVASLCNYMAPVLVILAAPALLHEPLDRRKLPLMALALAGIVLISGILGGEKASLPGVIMGLLAALCFTGIVLCNRKMGPVPLYDKAFVQLAVSAATVLPYLLARNIGQELTLDLRSAAIILLLGIVHTGAAYCFYFAGISSLPVETVGLLGYLEPVVSVLCSVLLLRESMSPAGWIGAALILTAAALSELLPGERKNTNG